METLFNCSLWGDEAFSAVLAQRSFWPMIKIVAKDTSPPLFYIISWLWFKIFGHSEITIRSLSLLFYLGTAFVVYLIGKELFNKRAGLLAAALTFFNPFLFLFAFEGRMYFCLLFFVTLSFYFLIRKSKLGHILSATAALYSHHFAFFAVPVQLLWQLFDEKAFRNRKKFFEIIKPYLIIGLLYLPWLYPLYLQTTLVSTGFWLGKPKLKDLAGTFTNFLRSHPILVLITLTIRRWSKKDFSKNLLLLLWIIFPPVITFLISQTKLSIFYERYLLYCIPPIMLLLASRMRKISLPITLIILAIYTFTSYHYFTHPFKRPFRQFAAWIKENVSENTLIVNYAGGAHHLWETKYYDIHAPLYVPNGSLPFYVGTAQMTPEDVISHHLDEQTIGIITSDDPYSLKIEGYQMQTFHQNDSLYFVRFTKTYRR